MPLLPDVTAILGTLARHKVELVVIGGVAVAHHGYLRATNDVDIVPEPTEENMHCLLQALVELEAEPLTLEGLLEFGNWDLATKYGRLDILQYLAGKQETLEDYEALVQRADETRFDFGTVSFAGYEDLIDFKNLVGREQDLIDIRALREARGDIGPE